MPGQPLREVLSLFGFKIDKQSWKSANDKVERMRKGLLTLGRLALGGGGIYAFKRLTDAVVETADMVDKTAGKIGLSTDALQEFHHAANLAGVGARTFNMGLQRMARRAAEAAQGKGEAKDALKELGIQLRNSDGSLRTTEQLFMDVAGAIDGVRDPNEKLRYAFKLFDSEGVALVNMLKGGKKGLEAVRKEARDLGAVMSQDTIAASVKYKDEMFKLSQVLAGLRNAVFGSLLPGMRATAKAFKDWVALNREWLASKISKALEIAGRALQRTGQFAQFMFLGIQRIGDRIGPLNSGLLKMAGVIGLMSLLFGVWPVVAIAAFLALEDIVSYFEGKKSVTGQIVEWLTELYKNLVEQPFDADNAWYVTVFQAIAKAGQTMLDVLDAILERLAGPIGDLLYGPGGVSLEKIGNVAGALPGAKALGHVFTEAPGAEAVGNAAIAAIAVAKKFKEIAPRIPGAETLGNLFVSSAAGVVRQGMNRPAARLAGQPQGRQSNVTIQQTINPPAGTSSAEVADMSGRKAAEGVSAAERREAMRVFAPQVAD